MWVLSPESPSATRGRHFIGAFLVSSFSSIVLRKLTLFLRNAYLLGMYCILDHSIIPNFLIQGGDFTHGDGRGGETIYNGELFEDESFEVPLNRPYVLVNSNKGQPNSNGSQFFITTAKTQWLQGKYVAFGKVLKGEEAVQAVEKFGSSTGEPSRDVRIIDCGEVDLLPEDKEVSYW